MARTQIHLGDEELTLLDREAVRTGASRSELIRRAVRERYGHRGPGERLAAIRASAGAWADRDVTGEEYVEAMRGDLEERLRRLGWS